jgi:hypothetical protein
MRGAALAGSVVYDVAVPGFREEFVMSGIALMSEAHPILTARAGIDPRPSESIADRSPERSADTPNTFAWRRLDGIRVPRANGDSQVCLGREGHQPSHGRGISCPETSKVNGRLAGPAGQAPVTRLWLSPVPVATRAPPVAMPLRILQGLRDSPSRLANRTIRNAQCVRFASRAAVP